MKKDWQKLYVAIILAVAVVAIIILLFKAPSGNVAGQVTGTACVPPPSGLVSWWPGDGNSNNLRGGNTGTIQGSVSYASGKVDQGFAFDGMSGVVTVGSQSAFRQSSAITYSFWVKIPSGGGGHIMGTGSRGGQGFGGLYLNQNVLYFYWTPSNPGSDTVITASNLNIPANEWIHVAVAIDFTNRQQSIYVNGQKLYDDITISRSSTNWLPLTQYSSGTDAFGGRFVNNWLYFRGSLDEVSVFNRFLSDQEIYSITNAGSAGMCKGAISAPVCGNGFIESGELCDDGNTISTDSCTSQCQPARCGDGIVQGGIQNEQCDDGNRVNGDGCTDTCRTQTSCIQVSRLPPRSTSGFTSVDRYEIRTANCRFTLDDLELEIVSNGLSVISTRAVVGLNVAPYAGLTFCNDQSRRRFTTALVPTNDGAGAIPPPEFIGPNSVMTLDVQISGYQAPGFNEPSTITLKSVRDGNNRIALTFTPISLPRAALAGTSVDCQNYLDSLASGSQY